MKSKLLLLAVLLSSAAALAGSKVGGYTKKDGTYVAPYVRSTSNKTAADNYSAQGNVNPYTGAKGTKDPYAPKKK